MDSDSPLGVAHGVGGSDVFSRWGRCLFQETGLKWNMGVKMERRETEKGKCWWISGNTYSTDQKLLMMEAEPWLSNPEILNILKLYIFSTLHSTNKKCQGSPFFNTMHLVLKLGKNYYEYPQRTGLTESSIRLLENLYCTQVALSYSTHI